MKKEKEIGPWFRYIHQGKYDPKVSKAICEFLDFFAQKRFGSRSYEKLIYRDMNWDPETIEYHLGKIMEYWKTGGFGYEFDNMRKELHQSFKNPQVIKMKTKLSLVSDQLFNEGIPHQERKQRKTDETVNFIEYFVTARLGYRSMGDYIEVLRNSTGKKREKMISQNVDLLEFWISGGKCDNPEGRGSLVKIVQAFVDGTYSRPDEYSDLGYYETKFRKDNI